MNATQRLEDLPPGETAVTTRRDLEPTLISDADLETTRFPLAYEETLIISRRDAPIEYADTELATVLDDRPTLEWIDLEMLYLLARAARAARLSRRRDSLQHKHG